MRDRLQHVVSAGNWNAAPLPEESAHKAEGLLGDAPSRRPP
jgi:hypothetical protein